MTTAQAFAGPDESHTISKMTATKVECQELNTTDGPGVEEIATYSYSVQEETVQKPQNGVLIEEFSEGSESQENRSRLRVNRGVSIVSVSDDESTLKAISRDISAEDVHQAESYQEDVKLVNGSYEELNGNGSLIEEKVTEKPYRASLITETIAEERSLEESTRSNRQNGGDGSKRKSSIVEQISPTIEDVKLSKRKIERVNSISTAEKVVEMNLEERRFSVQNGVSRQSSRTDSSIESRKILERSVSRETESKAGEEEREEVDEELEALLDRVKRQRSVLGDILEKEQSRDNILGKGQPSETDSLEKESSKADILERESTEESGTILSIDCKERNLLFLQGLGSMIIRTVLWPTIFFSLRGLQA